jgi:hypothetical protein
VGKIAKSLVDNTEVAIKMVHSKYNRRKTKAYEEVTYRTKHRYIKNLMELKDFLRY